MKEKKMKDLNNNVLLNLYSNMFLNQFLLFGIYHKQESILFIECILVDI